MDTWKGDYQGVPVAIKAFRAYATHHSEEKQVRVERAGDISLLYMYNDVTLQILWELIPMYKKLIHPNVAAFRGATTTLFPLALVYDWGEEDTILKYVQTHSEAQPLTLVRLLSHLLTSYTQQCSHLPAAAGCEGFTVPSLP